MHITIFKKNTCDLFSCKDCIVISWCPIRHAYTGVSNFWELSLEI